MQKLKRLDDLLEHDADRIDEARQADQPSEFQMQIDSTNEEIRRAFEGQSGPSHRVKAKLTDNA